MMELGKTTSAVIMMELGKTIEVALQNTTTVRVTMAEMDSK